MTVTAPVQSEEAIVDSSDRPSSVQPARPAHFDHTEGSMTETYETDVISEALVVIDRALGEMLHRELVSTDEVSDLLLDVRSLLTSPQAAVGN
jgi:hypothetical protein